MTAVDYTAVNLFLRHIACEYFFFESIAAGVAPEAIEIQQEFALGPDAFADVLVRAGTAAPFFVEIDIGYTPERILQSIARKYGGAREARGDATHLVIIAERSALDALNDSALGKAVRPGLAVETWDEHRFFEALGARFGFHAQALIDEDLVGLNSAIERTRAIYAFGDGVEDNALEASLLWHFGSWRLRQLRDSGRTTARAILPPGGYADAVVLMADLCSYSAYVRDTRDQAVARRALISYSSKTREQVLGDGGMLYQFLGDSVVGLFGLPERTPDYVARALRCARRLVAIGSSVALEWQRDIDHVQAAAGVHVALALGNLDVVTPQLFNFTRKAVVGDCINLCARLNTAAGCDEIVVNNLLYRALPEAERAGFVELPPIDAKNMGRVRAWKLGPIGR